MSARASAKEVAGQHAAGFVRDGMRVGLGTGSTVHHTIVALGERQPAITCAVTSERSRALAAELGLTVRTPDEIGSLDLAIDGANEVDADLNFVKGGGGALLREKIVAQMAIRFVVVVESKRVASLGTFGLPLEVPDFAPQVVAARVRALGAREVTTRAERSDNGNLLLDPAFGTIPDPARLGRTLEAIPGLLEHGLFLSAGVERVIVGGAGGVRDLVRGR